MLAWLAHWLGLDNPSGPQYLFWSGICGDLSLLGAAYAIVRRHNCHQPWCLRVGRFPHEQWMYCRRHHPNDDPGRTPVLADARQATRNEVRP